MVGGLEGRREREREHSRSITCTPSKRREKERDEHLAMRDSHHIVFTQGSYEKKMKSIANQNRLMTFDGAGKVAVNRLFFIFNRTRSSEIGSEKDRERSKVKIKVKRARL